MTDPIIGQIVLLLQMRFASKAPQGLRSMQGRKSPRSAFFFDLHREENFFVVKTATAQPVESIGL
jgi:hypothetical protein